MKYVKESLLRVKWVIIAVMMITFMAHGAILFLQSFGIDTDAIINSSYNFMSIGRQGLVWLAKLLDLEGYNLYLAQVLLACVMISVSGVRIFGDQIRDIWR